MRAADEQQEQTVCVQHFLCVAVVSGDHADVIVLQASVQDIADRLVRGFDGCQRLLVDACNNIVQQSQRDAATHRCGQPCQAARSCTSQTDTCRTRSQPLRAPTPDSPQLIRPAFHRNNEPRCTTFPAADRTWRLSAMESTRCTKRDMSKHTTQERVAPLFKVEGFLATAIEEKGNVRKLLGFCSCAGGISQLLQAKALRKPAVWNCGMRCFASHSASTLSMLCSSKSISIACNLSLEPEEGR